MRLLRTCPLLFVLVSSLARSAPVLVATEEASLMASDAAANDQIGNAVAVSADGTRALVGARFDDVPGHTDPGSARVFVRSGMAWSEEAMLVADDVASSDWSACLSRSRRMRRAP